MCDALRRETVLGFDVETTMYTRVLCLMQIACADAVYLVDALAVTDLAPIAPILNDPTIIKVIHNATFERNTLRRYDLELDGVVDTLVVSRRLRGKNVGRHTLKDVCARELGLELDKTDQTSDWSQRPLSASQRAYAALDAEVLLHLHAHFGAPTPDSLFPQPRLPGT
ncbi:ribonuclease D [Nannocystis pusilla]|uniref:Ribonuclease D n=1 Tax=Nannocystis pusilla TaxID=889268 RepID=A0A9X3J3M7_9BACT|nr:ribonuclease D [Nannocystis pusilla]MCY1013405.1 ribonuclease D [Nannocystis pusilla]